MSLDADHIKLTKVGAVTIGMAGVVVGGFAGDNCSCRDVAALALIWAIGELQRELMAIVREPGGGSVAVVD